MTIYIKNMVCNRCISAVRQELEKSGFNVIQIMLGEVELEQELDREQLTDLSAALETLGFELIDDKESRMIERIKTIVIEQVHHLNGGLKANLSEILSRELHHDYSFLSKLFSKVEGITIEKYYIAQKVEKVKELLVYDELSLSEIAYQLHYSSVAYLSNQFKKVTGLSPSHFKQVKEEKRKPLDKI